MSMKTYRHMSVRLKLYWNVIRGWWPWAFSMGGCLPGTSMVRIRAFLAKGRQSECCRLNTTWLPGDSGRVISGCLCMVRVLPGAGPPLLRWSNPTLPFLVEETEDWRQWVIWLRSYGGSWQNQERDLVLEARVPLCLCRRHSLISTNCTL